MENQTSLAQRSRRNAKKQKNKPPKKSNTGKNVFSLVSFLVLVAIVVSAAMIYHVKHEEALAQERLEAGTKKLLTQIREDREQSGISSTEKKSTKDNIQTVLVIPNGESGKNIPITDSEARLTAVAKTAGKKIKDDQSAVIVGKVAVNTSSKLETVAVTADTYIWNDAKKEFAKSTMTDDEPLYINTDTGKQVTFKDLVSNDEGNVLAIYEEIQQKLLDSSKNPKDDLDKVLNFPRITLDSQVAYTPEKITITLPDNELKQKDITLAYKDIAGYIDTSLVDPASVKDALPTLDPNKKYIALTFDDGPNDTTTPQILDILKQNDVKATFFMLGQMVEANPTIAKRVHDEGHEIGSHTYSHQQLNAMTGDPLKEEIQKADKAIFNATGILPRSMRPPYGAVNEEVATVAAKAIIQWDIDTMDWQSGNAAAVLNVVQQHAYNGGIVLMHDIHQDSLEALPNIIAYLKEQGYEMVTVDQLLGMKQKPLYQYFGKEDYRLASQ